VKIHTVVADVLHLARVLEGRKDRRTDITKLTVVFRNFANEPKNSKNKTKTVVPAGTY